MPLQVQASQPLLINLLFFECLLLLCAPCGWWICEHVESSDGEKRLYEDLLEKSGYHVEIRPRHDPSQPVVVDLELDLNHLIKLDEHTEVLQANIIVDAEWNDDYLVWDPAQYDNVEQIVLSPDKVWIPDIGIQNSATNFYPEEYFDWFRVHVHHTGRVRWWFGGVMETSCELDGTLFPFDHQSCSIIVQSWAYSEAYVDLRNASNFVHLDGFNDDTIWHLLATSVHKRDMVYDIEPNVKYAQIEFVLHLDRKPLYYAVNIILPCSLLVVISLLVYWLPPDSEDKISLSMTVMLAFSVLLFVVNETTPTSSDTTPVVGVFVMVSICLTTVSVITSIFIARINNASTPLPHCVRVIVFRYVARVLRVSSANGKSTSPSTLSVAPEDSAAGCHTSSTTSNGSAKFAADTGIVASADTADPSADYELGLTTESACANCCCQLKPQVDNVLYELRKITRRQRRLEIECEIAEEWRTLAYVVDRLLFWLSVIVLIGLAIAMIVKSSQHPDLTQYAPVYV